MRDKMTNTPGASAIQISPPELYRFIESNGALHREVISRSRSIVSHIDTLTKAMMILGTNTVKDIVIHVLEKEVEEGEGAQLFY